jgi:Zn-dependent protease/predicted transcriptional regulator
MKSSLYMGRYFDIKIFLHWSFLAFLLWIAFSNYKNGWSNIFWTLTYVISVFACITLHEFGHALVAKRFNIKTRDVTLYPIGGVASLEKMPEKPMQEIAVALAGPAVNVAIAFMLLPFVNVTELWQEDLSKMKDINAETFIPTLFTVNIILVLFNLIPAFPMDGGRVVRALLSIKLSRSKATRIAATLGQIFAVLLILEGFSGNPIIGFFVFLSAEGEARYVKQQEILRGLKVSDATMKQYPKLNSSETISEAVDTLLDSTYKRFLVMENDKVVGLLTDENIIKAIGEKGETARIGSIMQPNLTILNYDISLEEGLLKLNEGAGFLPVQKDGNIIGVLDTENVLELLLVRQMRAKKASNPQTVVS